MILKIRENYRRMTKKNDAIYNVTSGLKFELFSHSDGNHIKKMKGAFHR